MRVGHIKINIKEIKDVRKIYVYRGYAFDGVAWEEWYKAVDNNGQEIADVYLGIFYSNLQANEPSTNGKPYKIFNSVEELFQFLAKQI